MPAKSTIPSPSTHQAAPVQILKSNSTATSVASGVQNPTLDNVAPRPIDLMVFGSLASDLICDYVPFASSYVPISMYSCFVYFSYHGLAIPGRPLCLRIYSDHRDLLKHRTNCSVYEVVQNPAHQSCTPRTQPSSSSPSAGSATTSHLRQATPAPPLCSAVPLQTT